jgi:hypothetical protein
MEEKARPDSPRPIITKYFFIINFQIRVKTDAKNKIQRNADPYSFPNFQFNNKLYDPDAGESL